jgi:photosystem II stability/assembly factor-like uncharacterized protein
MLVFNSLLSLGSAQSTHWTPINSSDFDAVTEAFSVGFAEDGLTGFTGVGINGVGTEILKTTDGGTTWASVWPDADTKNPVDLFLGTAVKSRTSVVVTGVFAQHYTVDGTKFTASSNDYFEPAQDAGVMPGGDFGIVVTGKVNGVATSRTGALWTNFDMGVNMTLWPARYGSFPSQNTWYVSAGNFPTSNDVYRSRNAKLAQEKNGRVRWTYENQALSTPVDCSEDPTNCYSAGVFKTVDSGKTWTQVYSDINQGNNIYPNDIDCFDESNCIVVLEGDSCRIAVTNDGGSTWTETMRDTDPACSLTYVSMITATESWVAGGHLSALNFEGRFWHSTDSAQTWIKEAIKGLYILDLDMNTLFGRALGLDASGNGVELLAYNP